MHYSRILTLVAIGLTTACGNSDAARPSQEGAPATDAEPSTSPFQFAVDGRDQPMQGQARFSVLEGTPEITLTIVGGDAANNLVQINAPFAGVEEARGAHSMQLGLPDGADAYAVASFDGQAYYSQSGTLELSVSAEGTVEGRFDISFVEDNLAGAGAEVVFAPSAADRAVSGDFSGAYGVNCLSPVIGFPGGHNVADTAYCNNLEL
jgi:hypothetical protein